MEIPPPSKRQELQTSFVVTIPFDDFHHCLNQISQSPFTYKLLKLAIEHAEIYERGKYLVISVLLPPNQSFKRTVLQAKLNTLRVLLHATIRRSKRERERKLREREEQK